MNTMLISTFDSADVNRYSVLVIKMTVHCESSETHNCASNAFCIRLISKITVITQRTTVTVHKKYYFLV